MIDSYLTEPGFWILVGLPLAGLIQLIGTLASRHQFVELLDKAEGMSATLDRDGRDQLAGIINFDTDVLHLLIIGPARVIKEILTAPIRLWRVRGQGLDAHIDAIVGIQRKPMTGEMREVDDLAAKAFLVSRPFVFLWCVVWLIPLFLVTAPFLLSASGVFSKTVDAIAVRIVRSFVIGPPSDHHSRLAA